jgi:citrate synthase
MEKAEWRKSRRTVFYMSRTTGLTAHVREEQMKEPPMRRVYTWDDVEYQGPSKRSLT